ncbi:MAG: nicotinamide mononucleotide transporter [Gammaproteobacteria bacterium]|nr:nicotinamide mononucleotide transporter [Gammaproteobacteria bacterium]
MIEQWLAQSLWEWIAVILSIAYVVLAANANRWCWLCAFLSTAIFTVLFFDVNLLQESALNVYYLVMAVYGYWHWQDQQNDEQRPVIRWPLKKHLFGASICLVVASVSAVIADHILGSDFPYLNAFTVWFAVYTTYLVARKVLENWLFWIIINPLSAYMFWHKEMYVTVALMAVYFIMSWYGLWQWYRIWRQQNESRVAAATH